MGVKRKSYMKRLIIEAPRSKNPRNLRPRYFGAKIRRSEFVSQHLEVNNTRVSRRRTKRRGVLIVVILLLITILRVISQRASQIEVVTSKAKKTQLIESVSAGGRVEADKKINLTFQTGGTLVWIGVSEGDEVHKWQALASLDKSELELQLRKALNSWEKQFSEFDDTNDSVKDDVLNDAIRRIKKRAQIDLDQAQLDVEIQNEVNKLSTLISPISGIVTDLSPSVAGVNISPVTANITIADPDSIFFEAAVSELDVIKIKEGQSVSIRLDSYPNELFSGTVYKISFDSITTATGGKAYTVKISLPNNEDLKFRLGMGGDAEFIVKVSMAVISVPLDSIVEQDGKTLVWIVEEGIAKMVEVETGAESSDEIEIVSGLDYGTTVIVTPPRNLEEGVRIKS